MEQRCPLKDWYVWRHTLKGSKGGRQVCQVHTVSHPRTLKSSALQWGPRIYNAKLVNKCQVNFKGKIFSFKLLFDLEHQVLYFKYQIDIYKFLQHQQIHISTITYFTPNCLLQFSA